MRLTTCLQPANVVRMTYDERDLLFERIHAPDTPDQTTTRYDYDLNGNWIRRLAGVESGPHITTRAYDGFNRVVRVEDAMGNNTSLEYDPNGNWSRVVMSGELIDEPGAKNNVRLRELARTLDAMEREVRRDVLLFNPQNQTALGNGHLVTEVSYSDNSHPVRLLNENGHAINLRYDTVNRGRLITDAKGNTLQITYDANSNVTELRTTEKSDLGAADENFATTFSYDNLDRAIRQVDNIGNSTQFAYDSRGNVVELTNGRGHKTQRVFDGLRRLLETTRGIATGPLAAPIRTQQSWDDANRVVTRTDPRGNVTSYTYDPLSRLTQIRFADGTSTQTEYDAHSNPIRHTDPIGTITTLSYDALNRSQMTPPSSASPMMGLRKS
jgi:YD repeat-containing protein